MAECTRTFEIVLVSLGLIACVALAGCAAPQGLWYQAGKSQVDYDRDAQECAIIAGQFARQATITGASEDPAAFRRTLVSCLAGKGWSQTPPRQPVAAGTPPAGPGPLAAIDGARVRVFGSLITLPDGFSLAGSTSTPGPIVVETYLFSGPGETFINVMAQRAVAKADRFEYTPYPALPPFFLYEQGGEGTIFCGNLDGQWVMGLGHYLLVNARERITVIVTRALGQPQTEPVTGFRLSREQFAQVEKFKDEWLAWLGESVTQPPRPWWSRLSLSR